MRIVFTGGGTGGHFYPLIAVAEAIEDICKERTLIEPELFYTGSAPFDPQALQEHDITHLSSSSGKSDVFGFFKNLWGIYRATIQLFGLYPDVIFSTGGYAAFPTLYAARLLHIPVVIYDADAAPGKVSLWSSSFAKWIAVAHPDAAKKFSAKVRNRIARTGHPIRKEIEHPAKEGGYEFLKLDDTVPVIFIMGGSQGARAINEVVIDALPDLVTRYDVVHQVGAANLKGMTGLASVVLKDSQFKERYRVFGLLNTLALRMTAGIASLVISRAGSGTIFEIASWGVPAILVPIPKDVSHDQIENAFSYARAGGAVVIEQENLTPHILAAEIDRLLANTDMKEKMVESGKMFARPDASRKIAEILLEVSISHEPQ